MRHATRPLLASLALLLAACGRDSSPIKTSSASAMDVSPSAAAAASRDRSLVRVVNAVSSGRAVSVRLGDDALFSDLTPGAVSDYREVATDLAQFSVVAAGQADETMLSQADRILVDGNRYTVFVVTKDVSSQQLRVVRDDVIPDSGKARLRVIHAAPGGPELDIKVAGASEQTFSGVNYLSEAGPIDLVPTTSVALEIRAAGEDKVLMRLPAMPLRRGTSTTIVLTGTDKMKMFQFTDAVMAPKPVP